MPYISPEIINEIKRIDLKTYLERNDPHELVRISGNEYCTRTHDSLKISNGKWMWWSRGIGGSSALEYLIKVRGFTFYEAAKELGGLKEREFYPQSVKSATNRAPPEKKLVVPNKASNNDKVIQYLKGRGISENVIKECIAKGYIYESMPNHNMAFVGFDENMEPKYIGIRGTTEKRYLGDSYGSDKRYTFRLLSDKREELHLFEGVCDLLSYATLLERQGKDWKNYNLITLSGVYSPKQYVNTTCIPVAVDEYIKSNSDLKVIYLHFDNDIAGVNAAIAMSKLLSDKFEVRNKPPPYGKDVNDYLCRLLNIRKKSSKERNDAR